MFKLNGALAVSEGHCCLYLPWPKLGGMKTCPELWVRNWACKSSVNPT
jgi:hypothetical protein